MAHNETWTPTKTLAYRIRNTRRARGLTAEQLAQRVTQHGFPRTRGDIARIENEHRGDIGITEWLAISAALNVAPIHLLIPIEYENDHYQITPIQAVPVSDARAWTRGHHPLSPDAIRDYVSQTPVHEWAHPTRQENHA